MTWLRCDDSELNHPKLVALDDETFRLYHHSRLYASRHLTDGWVPRVALWTLTPLRGDALDAAVRALLLVPPGHEYGCWESVGEDYRVHDFLAYNPSREQVLAERASTTRRVALYRNEALTQVIRARDGSLCRYCGIEVAWRDRRSPQGGTYDHVDPRGGNVAENLVVACRACNAAKGSRTPNDAGMPLRPVSGSGSNGDLPEPAGPKVARAGTDADLQVISSYISAPVPSRPVPVVEASLQQPTLGHTGKEGRKEQDPPTPRPPEPLQAPVVPIRNRVTRPLRSVPKPGARPPTRKSLAPAPFVRPDWGTSPGSASALSPGVPSDPGAPQVLKRAIAVWLESFQKAHGRRPVLTRGKDAAILVRLIRSQGIEEVCALITGFFATGTRWSRENHAWTVGAFASQYDKLLVMQAEGEL